MDNWIQNCRVEHRHLERLIDRLEKGIAAREFTAAFREAFAALGEHYALENVQLNRFSARKLLDQHDEVLELGSAVEEALDAGQMGDALATVKRFAALASHNLIEEERDWFPCW